MNISWIHKINQIELNDEFTEISQHSAGVIHYNTLCIFHGLCMTKRKTTLQLGM